MKVRVIDLDGVGAQPPLAAYEPLVIPARDLAPKLRLWARGAAMDRLRVRLEEQSSAEPRVTFIGSGDFHHIAPLLIAGIGEPITVIHLDNHPDWVKLAPRHHCGAWVNRALELAHVVKVVTVGPTSADLDRPGINGGAFDAFRAGRIEVFPWERRPSRVFRRLGDGAGHKVRNGRIVWRRIGGEPWPSVCDLLVSRASTEAVWISIDKDVLGPQDAATNWDQGGMPLLALEQLLRAFGRSRRVVGADICGDWSPPVYDTVYKSWEAWFDRPHRPPGDLTVNARTNGRLLEILGEVMT